VIPSAWSNIIPSLFGRRGVVVAQNQEPVSGGQRSVDPGANAGDGGVASRWVVADRQAERRASVYGGVDGMGGNHVSEEAGGLRPSCTPEPNSVGARDRPAGANFPKSWPACKRASGRLSPGARVEWVDFVVAEEAAMIARQGAIDRGRGGQDSARRQLIIDA